MWRSFLTLGLLALVLGLLLYSMGSPPFSDRPAGEDTPAGETDTGDAQADVLTLSSDKPVVMDVTLTDIERSQLEEALSSPRSLATARLTLLELLPDEAGSRRSLRVYVDAPETEELGLETPGYAGTVSFGHWDSGNAQAASFNLNVLPALQDLKEKNLLDLEKGYVRVMVLARPMHEEDADESFRIAIAGATLTIVH